MIRFEEGKDSTVLLIGMKEKYLLGLMHRLDNARIAYSVQTDYLAAVVRINLGLRLSAEAKAAFKM